MASSPWKFLFGLGRRRDKVDEDKTVPTTPQLPQPAEQNKPAALDHSASKNEKTVDGGAEPGPQKPAKPSEALSKSDETAAARPVDQRKNVHPENAGIQTKPDRSPSVGRRKTAQTARTKTKPSTAAAPATPVPSPVTGSPVSHDVRELDDEIQELRRQLGERLRLQNAQLKSMLERFDRN